MSAPINDGGPAFPNDGGLGNFGMSLRAWFAGKALEGFCGNPSVFAANGMTGWGLVDMDFDALAIECKALADAMLKALEEK